MPTTEDTSHPVSESIHDFYAVTVQSVANTLLPPDYFRTTIASINNSSRCDCPQCIQVTSMCTTPNILDGYIVSKCKEMVANDVWNIQELGAKWANARNS